MGWIDSPAASGAIVIAVETGILHCVKAKAQAIMDLIPCDVVSSQILVQTAITATRLNTDINVVHAATTTKNPVRVIEIREHMVKYAELYPWYQQMA